jgi:multimeric flavodoxin WrbA
MVKDFIRHLSASYDKKKVLFLTTSNRWDGEEELPKSTQLAYYLADELKKHGVGVTVMEVPKMKIYSCEGNVSSFKGNTCGLKESLLKDSSKNPSGYHRCWASLNHKDDELWKISKELFQSSAVVFFVSVRWGQTNAYYQKLIERLNWIENMHTTLGESNPVSEIEAGCIAIGQNWRGAEVVEVQKQVYAFYGFKVPPALSFNWQFTPDANDETEISYIQAPSAFEKFFQVTLKGLNKIKESMKFLKFGDFLHEAAQFPHEIKSESYWKKIIDSVPNISQRTYLSSVLNTVMKKQGGKASDRQMEVLRRAASGDKTPYSTKN